VSDSATGHDRKGALIHALESMHVWL